jgi:hypothetical protein
MEKDKMLQSCYEWQAGNPKCDSWARNLSDELYKIGLGYIPLKRDGS